MRHFLTHRVSAFVPLLCAVLWASASCLAQEQPQAEPNLKLEIIPLKHITANQAQEAILQLLGHVPIVPDQRSNSLLISAPAEVIVSARQIVDKLESASPPLGEDGVMELAVFSLRHIRASQALELLNTMYLTGAARQRGERRSFPALAVDERNNRLLVRAPAQEIAVMESLLKTVDVDASPRTSGDARLRVVWLVAGLLQDELADSLPDDLNEVVGELRKHGINDLSLAAQTVVNISGKPQSRFSAQGTAPVHHLGNCQLEINGQVLNSEASSLNIAIEIKAQNIVKLGDPSVLGVGHVKNQFLCGLGTELALPPGHAVVLGVTPFERMTSVFVVQLLETPAGKKPSADKPSAGKPAAEPKGR
ncbi:MAG: secretin N-terminal domain-containing protein [Pirellulales bacterium]